MSAPVIEMRSPAALRAYEGNSRKHSQEQVDQLARSIEEFGFTVPVLIDATDTLIAGHGRVMAARQLGLVEIPTIRLAHLTDEQRRAYVIADNKLTENGEWDEDVLRAELEALEATGLDISLTGFDERELERIMLEREEGANDTANEWKGMPEFNQPDAMAWRSIIMHFRRQEDLDDFLERIGQRVTEKTKYLWHPENEQRRAADKSYE